jgi:hypothetical protein
MSVAIAAIGLARRSLALSRSVYRPDESQQIFHNGDALVVPDVLPGFSVPVLSLFE